MNDQPNETTRLPLWERLIERLERDGLLNYGQFVEWGLVLEVFRLSPEERTSWKFHGEWIAFTHNLKLRGYKVTEAGLHEKGFRFLLREEMADAVETDLRRASDGALRNSIMLSNVPRDELSNHDQSKLTHMEVKSAFIGATMKQMMRMRKLPATPDMARKQAQKMLGEQPGEDQ